MKLIEALKSEKRLLAKVEDLKQKVREHSAHLDFETPRYEDQTKQVSQWMDTIRDTLHELETLRLGIQKTNIGTMVAIQIGDNSIVKPLQSWIYRRRQLAQIELSAWQQLTDRGLQEARLQESTGQIRDIKLKRCYDPAKKDKMMAMFREEPSLIDSALEMVNAITDVVVD